MTAAALLATIVVATPAQAEGSFYSDMKVAVNHRPFEGYPRLELSTPQAQAGAPLTVTYASVHNWYLEWYGGEDNNLYMIRYRHNMNYCVDVRNSSKQIGAVVQLWGCNWTNAQFFKQERYLLSGWYRYRNLNSNLCLEHRAGDWISQGTCDWDRPNQKWVHNNP